MSAALTAALQATTPSGVKVKLVVPDGAEPGMNLTFSLPKTTSPQETQAAIKLQSISRGRKARKQAAGTLPRPAGPPPGSDPALEAAATKLQSSFRGHTARNEQQEASRLQWMEYYRQPHVAEFERALELAVSPAEEGEIKAAQAAYVEEEGRRLKVRPPRVCPPRVWPPRDRRATAVRPPQDYLTRQWLAHYLETGNLRDAEKLVVTSLEEAKLLRAQAVAANAPCACIGESKATIEVTPPRATAARDRHSRPPRVTASRGRLARPPRATATGAPRRQVHGGDQGVRLGNSRGADDGAGRPGGPGGLKAAGGADGDGQAQGGLRPGDAANRRLQTATCNLQPPWQPNARAHQPTLPWP